MLNINRTTIIMAVILIGVFGTGLLSAPAEEPYEIHTAQGKLTEVNPDYDTVVVEVPVEGKQMTVAGKLVPNAKVMKKDNRAELSEFSVDETVSVKWMVTDKGLNILELHQK